MLTGFLDSCVGPGLASKILLPALLTADPGLGLFRHFTTAAVGQLGSQAPQNLLPGAGLFLGFLPHLGPQNNCCRVLDFSWAFPAPPRPKNNCCRVLGFSRAFPAPPRPKNNCCRVLDISRAFPAPPRPKNNCCRVLDFTRAFPAPPRPKNNCCRVLDFLGLLPPQAIYRPLPGAGPTGLLPPQGPVGISWPQAVPPSSPPLSLLQPPSPPPLRAP